MSNTENLSQLVDIKALNTLYKSIQTQLNDRVYTTKGNAQEILGEPNFPYNNAYIVNIAKTEKIHIEKDGALFFKKKAEADEPESNQAKIYYDPNGFRFTEHLIPQVDSLNIGSTTTRINNLYSKNINTNSLESTGAIKLNGTDADDIIKVTNNASPETCVTINYQGIKGITAGKEELFLNKDLTDSVTNVGGYLTTGNKLTVGTSALDNTPKLGLDAHGYSNFYSYINSRGNIYTNGSLIANFGNTTKYIWIASDANENSTVLGNEGFGERFNGAGNGIENKTIFFSRHGGQETDVRTVKGDGSVFFHTSNVTFENNLRVGKGSNNPQISFRDTAVDGALLKYDISNDLFQIDTRNSNGSYSVTSFKNGKVTSRAFRGILVGDETSAKWEGALLASEDTTNASETDRSDDSPLGDTWIYADRQGKYWGIYHKQKPNEIIFSNGSGGSQHDEIILDLSNGDIDTVGNITGTNLTANTNITVGTVNDKENTGTITANHFVHRDGTDSNVLTGSGDVVTIDSLNVTGAKGLRADVGSESKPVYFEKKKGDTSSKAYEITSLNLGNHITNTGEISATNFYGRHVSLGENLENTLLVPSESLMSTTWIYTDLKKDSSGKIVPNGRGIYKDKDILSFNSSPSVKQFSFDISDAGGTLTLTKGIKYYNSGNNPDLNLITTLNKTINIGNSNITGVNIKFSDGSTGETNVAMDKNAVFRNYYPSGFSWTSGSTAGPTGTLSIASEGTDAAAVDTLNVSIEAIPSASKSASGIVTTGTQEFTGEKTFNNNVIAPGFKYKNGKIIGTESEYLTANGGKANLETSVNSWVPTSNGSFVNTYINSLDIKQVKENSIITGLKITTGYSTTGVTKGTNGWETAENPTTSPEVTLPVASTSNAGIVLPGNQTIGGTKTFDGLNIKSSNTSYSVWSRADFPTPKSETQKGYVLKVDTSGNTASWAEDEGNVYGVGKNSGLTLTEDIPGKGGNFAVDFDGTGSSFKVAKSDHDHDNVYSKATNISNGTDSDVKINGSYYLTDNAYIKYDSSEEAITFNFI